MSEKTIMFFPTIEELKAKNEKILDELWQRNDRLQKRRDALYDKLPIAHISGFIPFPDTSLLSEDDSNEMKRLDNEIEHLDKEFSLTIEKLEILKRMEETTDSKGRRKLYEGCDDEQIARRPDYQTLLKKTKKLRLKNWVHRLV